MHAVQSIVDGVGEEWKRALLGFLLLFFRSRCRLAAQEPAPRNQFTVDASILAGGLSYARMTRSDKLVGVAVSGPAFRREPTGCLLLQRSESSSRR